MQFIFSAVTAVVWSVVTILELTNTITEPFAFQPIRTLLMGTVSVLAITAATLHYHWQLWFARTTAVLIAIFLAASYWLNLLPEAGIKIPTLIALILWMAWAAFAGYQKKV